MDPLVGSAIVQGSSGFLGSLASGIFNRRRQKEAQRHAEAMNNQAWQREVEMWEKTNEYNSPIEQRKRIEEAGISPWSMYGQMNTGEAQNIAPNVAETIQPNYIQENYNMLGNAFDMYFQIKKFKSDQALVAQSLEREKAQTENQLLQNAQLKFWIDNLMEEEGAWKKGSWRRDAEAHEWKRGEYQMKEGEYQYKIDQYKRDAEKFMHDKELWKYDETGRKLALEEQRKKLSLMENEIGLYDWRVAEYNEKLNKMRQDSQIGYQELEAKKLDNWFEGERRRVLQEQGFDMKLDHWFAKTTARLFDNLNRKYWWSDDRKKDYRENKTIPSWDL